MDRDCIDPSGGSLTYGIDVALSTPDREILPNAAWVTASGCLSHRCCQSILACGSTSNGWLRIVGHASA